MPTRKRNAADGAQNDPQDRKQDSQEGQISDLDGAPRIAQALRLRRLGYTYAAIAQQCGYKTESGCRKAVLKASHSIVRDEAAALVAWQLDRIDMALVAVMTKVEKGDLWAVDRLTPLLKRQAELLALDAPKADADALALLNVRRVYERR